MELEQSLFDLWQRPPDTLADPASAFGRVDTDPVLINEVPFPVADIVARAVALHAAFTEHSIEVVDRVAEAALKAIRR